MDSRTVPITCPVKLVHRHHHIHQQCREEVIMARAGVQSLTITAPHPAPLGTPTAKTPCLGHHGGPPTFATPSAYRHVRHQLTVLFRNSMRCGPFGTDAARLARRGCRLVWSDAASLAGGYRSPGNGPAGQVGTNPGLLAAADHGRSRQSAGLIQTLKVTSQAGNKAF